MPKFRFTRCPSLLFGIALVLLPTRSLFPQQAPSQGTNAQTLISQVATAFSRGQVVHQIEMSGNATWHVGSLEDSGTATLTASSDGSSQMQLLLAASGQRTETQSGMGTNATCQWAGADGVAHNVSLTNCWKPALWFLPAFSLQPTLLPGGLEAVDLGTGAVGAGLAQYRHLESQLLPTALPSQLTAEIMKQSTSDLGLDPVSLLPTVLAYSLQPDNGAFTPIAIEIHYGDYRIVNGVEIPFQIERYVNGCLQLDITVSTAQVN